ncbi:MAG: 3-oxoacyl-ACP synthase III family protein [Steroidobacteraceae bacterium]
MIREPVPCAAPGGMQAHAGRVATHARIVAAGAYLPGPPVSSRDVEERIAAASPGLRQRRGLLEELTGIRARHYLPDHMQASDLAVEAARRALDSAALRARDIDLLLWGSASQDLVEPATAHIVAAKLGLKCHAFDVKNACNSFLNALHVASTLIGRGAYRTALVVTGESPSRAIRWSVDHPRSYFRSAAGYTMGDAGAATVLVHDAAAEGIYFQDFRAASEHWPLATLPGGGSMHPRGEEWTYFFGDGAGLRDAFIAIGPAIIDDALDATRTAREDYARVLCHQVTVPFLGDFCASARIAPGKLVPTIAEIGNVASATIPVQLARAIERGLVAPGDQLMLAGLGGGLSLGVILLTL